MMDDSAAVRDYGSDRDAEDALMKRIDKQQGSADDTKNNSEDELMKRRRRRSRRRKSKRKDSKLSKSADEDDVKLEKDEVSVEKREESLRMKKEDTVLALYDQDFKYSEEPDEGNPDEGGENDKENVQNNKQHGSTEFRKEDTVLALYNTDFKDQTKSDDEENGAAEIEKEISDDKERRREEKMEKEKLKESGRKNKEKKRRGLSKRRSTSNLLHYEWDKENIGENITILEDKPHVARREVAKQSTDAVRGHRGFTEGRHTFEILFNDKPWGSHCAVGVCTKNAGLHCEGYKYILGCDNESWGWDIPCKALIRGGEFKGELNFSHEEEEAEKEGAIIESQVPRRLRMIMDLESKTLSYDLGNDRIVTAFTDLEANGEELFPCVGLVYGLLEAKIRLRESKGKDDLANKEETLEKTKEVEVGAPEQTAEPQENEEAKPEERPVLLHAMSDLNKFESATSYGDDDNAQLAKFESATSHWDEEEPQGPSIMSKIDEQPDINTQSTDEGPADEGPADEGPAEEGPAEEEPAEEEPAEDLYALLISRTKNQLAEEEETDDEEDLSYRKLADMSDEDRYLVRLAHGWDNVMRGGLLVPHPNIPYICVPMPNLQDKVQAVRCKRGFSKGRHIWAIKELKFYSPTVHEDDLQDAQNDIIIGVVNEQQRVFNYGFSLSQLGRNAWGFQPHSKLVWHDSYYASPQDMPGICTVAPDLSEQALNQLEIDMTVGIELTLDRGKRTMDITYDGKEICKIQKLKGKTFYPFVLFHKITPFPIEIDYLGGPEDYIDTCVEKMRDLCMTDQEESSNFRPMLKRSSSRFITDPADTSTRKAFGWGHHSQGVHISGIMNKNVVDIPSGNHPEMMFSMYRLSGGRHVVKLTMDKPNQFVVGLVGNQFNQESAVNSNGYHGNIPIFGELNSWGWNIEKQLLYHAGIAIGRYPVIPDFDINQYESLLLTIDFSLLGYNVACFTAVRANGEKTELGLAWVNLAPQLGVAAARIGGDSTTMKLEYHAGSWKYSDRDSSDGSSTAPQQSATCVVL